MAEPAPEPPPVEEEPLVRAERLLSVADGPPLAPDEPDEADRRPLLPLELLAWDGADELIGVRCTGGQVTVRTGRPPQRRTVTVKRITRWARAGRLTLHAEGGDLEVRLLAPEEYADVAFGDERHGRVAGPLRMARSGQLSGRRDDVARTLVARVLRVFPEAQVGNE